MSDLLETKGPRAFCAREQVLYYFSDRQRGGGKLTPGRRLLFRRGEFEAEEIINRFMRESAYYGNVYAKWSCRRWKPGCDPREHNVFVGDWADACDQRCPCGARLTKYNEIDLRLPGLLLTGHPDFILRHNGVFYVYEFKSMDRADVSFDDLRIPLASHRLQVSFYYRMMAASKMRTSNRLTVLYVDRSNSKIWGGLPYKELPCRPEPMRVMQGFKNRLLHVKSGIENKKLPDRICPDINHERARQCPFAVECFARTRSTL